MSELDSLAGVRARIDELDRRIQELINERAACAQEVARVKTTAGDTGDFYRPDREAQVLSDAADAGDVGATKTSEATTRPVAERREVKRRMGDPFAPSEETVSTRVHPFGSMASTPGP